MTQSAASSRHDGGEITADGIPGMTVFAPADEADMLAMLPAIWASPQPAYLRVNTRPATYEHAPFEIGKAEIVAEGTDITILTYGMLFEQARQYLL